MGPRLQDHKCSNLTLFFFIKLSISQADVMHLGWDEFSSEWIMQVGAGGATLVPLGSMYMRMALAVVGPTCGMWAFYSFLAYTDIHQTLLCDL